MKRRKLLFIYDISLNRSGGLEPLFISIDRKLSRRGFDLHYVVRYPVSESFRSSISDTSVLEVWSESMQGGRSFWRLLKLLHRLKPQGIVLLFFPIFAVNSLLLGLLRKTVFLDHDSSIGNETSGIRRLIKRIRGFLVSRIFVYVVSPSNFKRKYNIERGFIDARKCVSVYNGIQQYSNERKLWSEFSETGYFLFVGRIIRSKGVFDLLEAYAAYTSCVEAPRALVFVGDGDQQELVELSRKFNLGDKVHALGFRSNVERYIAKAFCVVVPSVCAEAFGLIAGEAMSLGVPLIVSDSGALPELVGDTATIFSAGSVQSLADAMVFAHKNPTALSANAKRAQRRAWTQFALDACADDYVTTFSRAFGE